MENLYIEMCSKATQLQDKKREVGFKDGDRVCTFLTQWDDYIDRVSIVFECGDSYWSHQVCKDTIWLPRQEDLQSLLNKSIWELNQSFHHWFLGVAKVKIDEKRSMDVLWLEYTMKELYSKRWVEGEWVYIEKGLSEDETLEKDIPTLISNPLNLERGDYVLVSFDDNLKDPSRWLLGILESISVTKDNTFGYKVEGCSSSFEFIKKITKEEGAEKLRQWR